MTDQTEGQPELAEPRPTNLVTKRRRVVVATAAGAALTVAIVAWAATAGDEPPAISDQSPAAEQACQDFVSDRLKSPATAEYSEITTDYAADVGEYTVRGAVDSENSFGAMIRNTFRCVAKLSGDRVQVVRLDGLSN